MQTARHFFSLEGIDGSGKTTQLEKLADRIGREGFEVVKLREPGGAKISESIREILLNPAYKGVMDDKTELLLYNAARAQVIAEIVKPALAAGKVVIADRFAWSTLAYQGYGRKIAPSLVERLTEITCGDCFPAFTAILDISVERSQLRMKNRGAAPDRMESERRDFFERVQKGYRAIAQNHPEITALVKADRSPEAVFDDIWEQVLNRL